MKKSTALFTILMFFSLTFTGCWDYIEYDAMTQVTGMGIDYNKDSNLIALTVQYVSTSRQSQSDSTGRNKAIVHSAYGKTFMDALSNIEQALNKKMFYGYTKIMVLGSDLTKYKLSDFIEFLERTPLIRNTIYIAIANGKAEDIISTVDPSQEMPSSEQIYNIINVSEHNGTTYPVTLQSFCEMLAIPGLEATVPFVVGISSGEGTQSLGGKDENVKYDEELTGSVRVKGNAVFKKDKLAGWLNYKEGRGFKFITGKNMQAYTASNVSDNTDTENVIYFRLNRVKSKIKPRFEDDKIVIDVNVSVVAELRKYYTKEEFDILSPEKLLVAEKALSDSIFSDIQAVLTKCQTEYNSDIFGFGFAVYRKNTKLWRDKYESEWDDIFPDIKVNIKINATVKNTGTNFRKFIIK